MRFTLGTTIGLAVGVAAAPVLATAPGLGPLVERAQANAAGLIGAHWKPTVTEPDDPGSGRREDVRRRRLRARARDRATPRPSIVSLAAITGMKPAPDDGAAAQQSTLDDWAAEDAVEARGIEREPAPPPRDPSPHDTANAALPPDDVAVEHEGFDAAELERQVGVLDRLFATYDRVDEE